MFGFFSALELIFCVSYKSFPLTNYNLYQQKHCKKKIKLIFDLGPKLYKQPATKSNRGIILNAVEFCVFPGIVNRDAKQKVLEKIEKSEAKHFLVLFRDAGCQFRALYSYWPENESVIKLHGTGPTQVDEYMFDKFFK